ncbi:HAD-IIA family hydrolase [Nocardioides guangzhouensis]|uniref:HAD-IIA family hydrolase n=2 Tax=Nocardioides guangzhouensis TaxID=2497878 RepID=A0A4Q4ZEP7_9ACTN|nr:HAD-IIA family hydrolase [Nocardioides guangzhouensis]
MLDLDGVVYIGAAAVDGAPEHLRRARTAGLHLAFVTNNASRPPQRVADHLVRLGVEVGPSDVVTSAQAAAHLLADRLPTGARVFTLGGDGLREALVEEGLEPVGSRDDEPAAVVTGYGPDVVWRDIMVGAVLIRDGLPWVASNTDMTIPTDYGIGPGHGVQVRMLREFSGVEPEVAGKPQRPLLDETVRRVGGDHPLMVGDRLDTDIEGAHNAGVDSLCVLTGVSGLADLAAADRQHRPTYLSRTLEGLFTAHPVPEDDGAQTVLGGWRATVVDGRLCVDGDGRSADDWWRAVVTAAWRYADETGEVADTGDLRPPE